MEKQLLEQTHNQILFDEYEEFGPVSLGPYSSYTWRHDPKHILFTLARYKFCAKMLAGKKKVLEIGCGDGIGASILLQAVGSIYGIDLETPVIENDIQRFKGNDRVAFARLDMTKARVKDTFDAAVCLDVIEHIPADKEREFMGNICCSLTPEAVCVVGTPNITANPYASTNSAEGHVNLKSNDTLTKTLSEFFANVFIFSMNDEVIHTGFYPMAHYLMAVGVGLKSEK